jgi:hypothetical protein
MSNLSRRSLVASAAALPTLAVPAVAVAAVAEPDPILAAIERWKELDVLHSNAIDAEAAAEEVGAPDVEQARCHAAGHTAADAAEAIFKTVPVTLAGMRAKIDFAFHVEHVTELLLNNGREETEGDTPRQFIETLYEAARLLAVRS